jgi:hypothetical protein
MGLEIASSPLRGFAMTCLSSNNELSCSSVTFEAITGGQGFNSIVFMADLILKQPFDLTRRAANGIRNG